MISQVNINKQKGVSLVELMISMVIGVVMLVGILNIFVNSKKAYHASQSQFTLLSDANFATHLIRQDVLLSGSYGYQSTSTVIVSAVPDLVGDCAAQWYVDVNFNISGSDDSNPYSATCIDASKGYKVNTDTLVVRYANPIIETALSATTLYIQTTLSEAQVFISSTAPTLASSTVAFPSKSNKLQAVAYYVSDFTDVSGDGYPSLHRIYIADGPVLQDDLVVPGVEDMQIQYGIDENADGSVDYYVNVDNVALDWTDSATATKVKSIAVSLVMVAEEQETGLDTSQTLTYADKVINVTNDGKYRKVITTVLSLTNIIQ